MQALAENNANNSGVDLNRDGGNNEHMGGKKVSLAEA
jgi:hypothetical protein